MEKDLQIKYSKALQEVQRERNKLKQIIKEMEQEISDKDKRIEYLEDSYNIEKGHNLFLLEQLKQLTHKQDKGE